MNICLRQSLAKFGHVENMHFLNALLVAWFVGTAWLLMPWPLLKLGPMSSTTLLYQLGFEFEYCSQAA